MKDLEIATHITTPMALAALALCLMLGTGLLKVVAKAKRPNAALKLIIRWGFIVALVFGVLANISYLVIASFGREVRLAGTVRDEAEKPIPFAIADLGGKKGRAITDDYGEFELNIPGDRTTSEYHLTVSAEGFASTNVPIKGPHPKGQVEVRLHRPVFVANDYAKINPTLVVRHYLGNPQIVLTVDFANPLAHKIALENIALILTSPSGTTISVALEGTAFAGGSLMPAILPALPLEKSQNWTLGCSFCNPDQGITVELAKAQAEVPLFKKMPEPGEHLYSDGLVNELRDFMKTRMIWKAGEWSGRFTWSVEGKNFNEIFRFSLLNDDITRMTAISKYYAAGYGVLPDLRFYPVADANPTTVTTLQQ